MQKKTTTETVKGHKLAAPRLTRAGYRAIIFYGVMPALGILLLFDLGLWALFHFAFHRCYGLWCLLP